ncbi:MAG: penicillin acylase family protein [Polyangiaceae bacterium]
MSGTLIVNGASAPLTIIRDAYAVPHIYARSQDDAAFGLGYAHAQDRLWQLELSRRMGSGTLAEIFGREALQQDRLFRVLKLRAIAVANLGALDARSRAALDAYARGVNAQLQSSSSLPPEFAAFGVHPRAWQAVDSLVWLKVMSWMLSGNWSRELARLRLSNRLSAQQAAEFLGPDALPQSQWRELYGTLERAATSMLATVPFRPEAPVGSNNWAVDGSRSVSGKPLLANDPHLNLSAPSIWYLAHLNAPGLNVIGATLPALPVVMLGRNDHVAWAFTNTESDTQDLFIEKVDTNDPTQYLTPTGFEPFQVTRELIGIKDEPDEVLLVRESRHGPIISDVQEETKGLLPGDTVMALSWVGLRSDDLTLQFPLEAATSSSAAGIAHAARDFHSPQQNIVYADDGGKIGFVAAGRVPLRSKDNELRGHVPAPGWLSKYDWLGTVPFEALPRAEEGASLLVTANQDIQPPGYPFDLGSNWAPPFRVERIRSLLDAVPLHSLSTFQTIQSDVWSRTAAETLPLMLRVQPRSDDEREAVRRLRTWNLDMRAELGEPLIYATWLRELTRLIYADELGDQFSWEWSEMPRFVHDVLADRAGMSRWCANARTAPHAPCEALLSDALSRAIAYLKEHYGSDPSAWTWGMAHRAVSEHTPLGHSRLLSRWFNLTAPTSGDNETVNVGGYSIASDTPFRSDFGPGYRALYDLGAPESSVFVINSGESGHFLSKHYGDLGRLWQNGQYIPMITQRETVEHGAIGTLVLSPATPAVR